MKRVLLPVIIAIAVSGFIQAQSPTAHKREDALASLRAAEDAAIQAFASKNADRMFSAYSPDANLMLSNSPTLKGKELRAALEALVADPNFSMTFHTDAVVVADSGELGYTRGTYTLITTAPNTHAAVREQGKYITIYRRVANSSWKMIEDISNADSPATPVATTK